MQSIYGRSTSVEDTEKVIKGILPIDEEKTYRVTYAVHEILGSTSDSVEGKLQLTDQVAKPTEFIGLVTLKSLDAGSLALPENLTIPAAAATTTLVIELSYSLLPKAWGKGYATESLEAVFQSCKRARSFWAPFSKLYVRAIVNQGNPPSMRVMDKTGMNLRGIFEWTGKVFLGGEWRTRDKLHIYGMHLLE